MRVLLLSEDPKLMQQVYNLLSDHLEKIVLTSIPENFLPNFSQDILDTFEIIIQDTRNRSLAYQLKLKNKKTEILRIVDKITDSNSIKFLKDSSEQTRKIKFNEDFDRNLIELVLYVNNKSHIEASNKLKFSLDSNEMEFKGKKEKLTKTEYEILKFFLANKNKVVSRDKILDSVWDRKSYDVVSNTIDVHMSSIRNKMKKIGANVHIETVHGFGYKFED